MLEESAKHFLIVSFCRLREVFLQGEGEAICPKDSWGLRFVFRFVVRGQIATNLCDLEKFSEGKFGQNPARIFLLIAVRRPKRSESPQGVVKIRRIFEFGIRRWRDATIFYKIKRDCVKAGGFCFCFFF